MTFSILKLDKTKLDQGPVLRNCYLTKIRLQLRLCQNFHEIGHRIMYTFFQDLS